MWQFWQSLPLEPSAWCVWAVSFAGSRSGSWHWVQERLPLRFFANWSSGSPEWSEWQEMHVNLPPA